MRVKRRIIAIAVAVAMMIVALVGVAAAQDGAATAEKAAAVEVGTAANVADTEVPEDGDDEGDHSSEECLFDEDWEPSAQEIAEINAETDALVEYLQGLGFAVTVETDELGITYVDAEALGEDEALFAAIDDFYSQMFADEVAGWSDEEKAEWNAEIDAFVAELAAEGITVDTEEIAPGVYDIVWTEELEELLWDLEDDLLFDEFEDDDAEEDADEDADEDAEEGSDEAGEDA